MKSSKLWVRGAMCGLVGCLLIAACIPATDKDDDDDDGSAAGAESGGGKGGTGSGGNSGEDSGVGGAPEGGNSGGTSGAPGTSGDAGQAGEGTAGGDGPGGTAGTGGTAGIGGSGGTSGSGGSSGSGGKPPVTDYEDVGRGTTGPLVFQVTSVQSPAVPGQALSYAITVGNTGDVAASNVSVLMRLPVGMSVAYAADALPDTDNGCGNYVCDPNEEATWTLGSLPAQSTQTIWVRGNILATVGEGDEVAPLFRLSAKDQDVLNITRPTPVQAVAPAELTLTASADPVVAGQLVELSLDIGQTGATPLAGAALRLELPGSLQVESVSDSGKVTGNEVSWTIGAVAVGASFHRSIWVKVHPKAVPGDVLNPRASLTFDGGLEVDDVAQVPLSVVPEAEPLSLTVTQLNGPAAPGGTVAYQMTVANTALRAVDGITMALQVPPEVSFAYAQDSEPDTANGCSNYVCAAHEEAPWTIGTLEAGTSKTVTVIATVPANAAGSGTLITTPFAVRAAGINPVNALKTVPVFAKPASQLILGTEVSPVVPGQTFTYDLDVGQVGAKALAATKLVAYLPSGVTVGTISDGGTVKDGMVTWDLATVGVAETRHRSVQVTVPADAAAGSTLMARSRLSYTDGLELDAQSEYPVSVVAEPLALGVTLTAAPAIGVPGQKVLYSTTIKNNSARAVDNLRLLLRTGDYSFGYAADADPDTDNGCGNYVCGFGEEASWTFATLKPGGSTLITANATVLASLTGGSLLVSHQVLTATELGGTILLQKTVPTKTP